MRNSCVLVIQNSCFKPILQHFSLPPWYGEIPISDQSIFNLLFLLVVNDKIMNCVTVHYLVYILCFKPASVAEIFMIRENLHTYTALKNISSLQSLVNTHCTFME